MIINTFLKNKIINNWFNNVIIDTNNLIEFKTHNTIFSFSNELSIKLKTCVAIIDLEYNNYNYYTTEIIKSNDKCKFIGVGLERDCTNIVEKINNHINGYLSIHSLQFSVLQAISSLENQNSYFNNYEINQLLEAIKNNNKRNTDKKLTFDKGQPSLNTVKNIDIVSLTDKENRVCKLLTQGYSYKEIAEIIGLTIFTVNQKSKNIYKKLGVRSRAELSYKILN